MSSNGHRHQQEATRHGAELRDHLGQRGTYVLNVFCSFGREILARGEQPVGNLLLSLKLAPRLLVRVHFKAGGGQQRPVLINRGCRCNP